MKQVVGLRTMRQTVFVAYLFALATVGLMSLLIGVAESYLHIANVSTLYLIPVLATAVVFGRGPAVFASVAAFFTYNWFFVRPVNTLMVADPAEWLALLLLLLTAVITGQLAAVLRQRAEVARQREREAVVLYDVVRLMSQPELERALGAVAERLRHELDLAGVSIELQGDGAPAVRAAAGEQEAVAILQRGARPPAELLASGASPTASQRGGPGRWVRIVAPHPTGMDTSARSGRLRVIPVTVRERMAGRLLLLSPSDARAFTFADDRLLSAVATQLGLAVERTSLQREATEAEILRRADGLKSALLNAVSHDLRTPLASIVASATSLRLHDVEFTKEERQDLAAGIEEEGMRLNQIVGNLLDLSRIEGDNLCPQKDWYDLSTMVDEVLGRLRSRTGGHPIKVSIPEDLPPLYVDYVEIDQVLSNLIENASKHTTTGTPIEIAARRHDGEVLIEVIDFGSGIPSSALPHLFEPFFRVGTTQSRPKGTGLGLAVAKGLIEAHGGRIWAENRPKGGARFVFALPLAQPGEKAGSEAVG